MLEAGQRHVDRQLLGEGEVGGDVDGGGCDGTRRRGWLHETR